MQGDIVQYTDSVNTAYSKMKVRLSFPVSLLRNRPLLSLFARCLCLRHFTRRRWRPLRI
jgi:hypothetical protein